jgi:hypothetical protein
MTANSKRKMPKKLATLDFGEDGYEGFHCETWVNPPLVFIRRMGDWSGSDEKDADEATRLFLEIFPSWDFVDFEGAKIRHSKAGIDYIPDDLASAMWARRAEAISERVMPAPLGESSSEPPSGLGEASKPLTS